MYHRWYGILIQKTKSKKQCENRSSKTCAVNSCSYNKTTIIINHQSSIPIITDFPHNI